jgi:hypothetical protein
MSKAVPGKMVWLNRDAVPVQAYHQRCPTLFQRSFATGLLVIPEGVLVFDPWPTLLGTMRRICVYCSLLTGWNGSGMICGMLHNNTEAGRFVKKSNSVPVTASHHLIPSKSERDQDTLRTVF